MRRALLVQAGGDFQPIDGVAPVKMFGHQPAFVGLQGTNKVPLQSTDACLLEMVNLLHALLDVVFTKCPLACRNGFFDRARRFRFTHCKQCHFFWRTPASGGSTGDFVPDLCQVMRNIVHIPRMSYEAGRNRSP